ncbi:hypothetical protein E0Z10_g2659 [Xylaria hypoxylon]|uniref:RNase MRP protein 1 RNA binding domain-containing protein n=1 Tax=Xylaria hypoxylon TaxID=37992 RepID=A0A4Z0Z3S9_9PEZI|nr:hypothetical protein E0Z10_g2659 [Xylaria hypoxylon]
MATQKSAARSRSALTTTQTASTNIPVAEAGPEEATPYSRALCRLEPLQPVLVGLAHRNYNQHRCAAWWRYFGMLRRNCARLVEHLISAVAAARKNAARAAKAAKAAKAKSKKRRREELASGDLGARAGGKDGLTTQEPGAIMETDVNVARHAAWLRDVLVPKCYLAFSQLTADNQFAPLGVVLLGILAQIQAACDVAVPRPTAPPPSSPFARDNAAAAESPLPSIENTTMIPEDGNTAPLSAVEVGSELCDGQTPPKGKKESQSEKGEGRTISREDVEHAAELRTKANEMGKTKAKGNAKIAITNDRAKSSTPSKATEVTASMLSTKGRLYSAQEGGGDELARPAKKMKKNASVAKEKGRGMSDDKDKKKKKKPKKGDEFDDLFKGLF